MNGFSAAAHASAAIVLIGAVMYMSYATVSFERFNGFNNKEGFAGTGVAGSKMDQDIMDVYSLVLDRQPSPKELGDQRAAVVAGTKTIDSIARELKDQPEYIRMLKTQSNALAPELPKLIHDRDILDLIALIYKEERKKAMPKHMLLPLKDVYVYLSYNNYRFRAFLRMKNYERFEEMVVANDNLDHEALVSWIDENVDKAELAKLTEEIQKAAEAQAAKAGASASAAATVGGLVGTGVGAPIDGDGGLGVHSAEYIAFLEEKCALKDAPDGQCTKRMYLPHEGQMVLRPEFAWSVPQQRPPVCIPVGKTYDPAPLMVVPGNLIGTPLAEAADTAVGSMLPNFEFKPYVDVPVVRPTAAQCKAVASVPGK
jgi:hypothetical protein